MAQIGVEAQETVAMGDGMNDKEMLNLVGHRVVMDNATDAVKALIRNPVIAKSNAEEGGAIILKTPCCRYCRRNINSRRQRPGLLSFLLDFYAMVFTVCFCRRSLWICNPVTVKNSRPPAQTAIEAEMELSSQNANV